MPQRRSCPGGGGGDQLLGGLELADDLFRRVPGASHGEDPGPVWPNEVSHSPWTDLRGPRLCYQVLAPSCY